MNSGQKNFVEKFHYESIDENNTEFSSFDQHETSGNRDNSYLIDGGIESCKCLPSCTSIHYDAEVSQAHLNWMRYAKARKFYKPSDEE